MPYESPLSEYQESILAQAREMIPGNPPQPWRERVIVPAAGVLAGGWVDTDNFLLISSSGYSVSNPRTGKLLTRDRDEERTYAMISSDYLRFTLPNHDNVVDIWGLYAGDGIHLTTDGWELETIHPWWPHTSVIIREPFIPGSAMYKYLDRATLLELQRIDGWIRCGFSPSGTALALMGSGGAEFFSR